MITSKNFSGLDTPQDFGILPGLAIPAITKPVYASGGIRIVTLDVGDLSYIGRWIVSDDLSRAWKLKLRQYKDRDGKTVATHYVVTDEVGISEPLAPSSEYTTDFQMTDLPVLLDRTFQRCNFTHKIPVDVAGKKRGVRLFPGDDRPHTFTECNLCNCEPPPGSTVTGCLTVVKEFALESGTERITVDGQSIPLVHHIDRIHGGFDPATGGYIDKPTPEDIEVD